MLGDLYRSYERPFDEEMRAYIIRRVLLLIPTFLLLSILVFLSVRFLKAGRMQPVRCAESLIWDMSLVT